MASFNGGRGGGSRTFGGNGSRLGGGARGAPVFGGGPFDQNRNDFGDFDGGVFAAGVGGGSYRTTGGRTTGSSYRAGGSYGGGDAGGYKASFSIKKLILKIFRDSQLII